MVLAAFMKQPLGVLPPRSRIIPSLSLSMAATQIVTHRPAACALGLWSTCSMSAPVSCHSSFARGRRHRPPPTWCPWVDGRRFHADVVAHSARERSPVTRHDRAVPPGCPGPPGRASVGQSVRRHCPIAAVHARRATSARAEIHRVCGWSRSPCNSSMPWTKSSTVPPFFARVVKSRRYRWLAARFSGRSAAPTLL